MIEVTCIKCRRVLSVDDKLAGFSGKCACGASITIPVMSTSIDALRNAINVDMELSPAFKNAEESKKKNDPVDAKTILGGCLMLIVAPFVFIAGCAFFSVLGAPSTESPKLTPPPIAKPDKSPMPVEPPAVQPIQQQQAVRQQYQPPVQQPQHQQPVQEQNTMYYISPKGKCYHYQICPSLRKSGGTPLLRSEAIAQGYKPCGMCKSR